MDSMLIVPVSDLDIKEKRVNLQNCIALYKCDITGVINVGYPSLASYVPALANMYGFKDALEKGYYLVLKNDEMICDKPLYKILLSDEKTVVESIKINSAYDEDLLSDLSINKFEKTK